MSTGETKFKSPLPFLIKARNLIFGEESPGWYTQLTFFIDLIVVFIFGLWSSVSYFAIVYHELFFKQKGVDVSEIIELRGKTLGFEPGNFISRLETFHGVSMVCWLVAFVGLILLWRKSKYFVWFFFGSTIFYFGMLVIYIGFTYYKEDTTSFDKILFLTMMLQTFIYFLLSNRTQDTEQISFFD